MNIRTIAVLLSCLIFGSCSSSETPINHNIYHFTACSFVSTAVVFLVPEFKPKKAKETTVTIRGEIKNNSRLLVRKDERENLSLPLKKGSLDTTFSIQTRGEALSFYFLIDSAAGYGEQEKATGSGISGQLSYIQEAASDAIGIFEMIVRR